MVPLVHKDNITSLHMNSIDRDQRADMNKHWLLVNL